MKLFILIDAQSDWIILIIDDLTLPKQISHLFH